MARPFLKWAGGKTQLLPILLKVIPESIGTYFEPFLGGGAVFFALSREKRFRQAILNDYNFELVETYRAIRNEPENVIEALKGLPFEREFYEQMRLRQPISLSEKAARIIYLNKTSFNGLYRVNQRGQFNVPFGAFSRPPRILDAPNLLDCSDALEDALVCNGDFVPAVSVAREGDVVYFDPPYVPINTTSNFTSYTKEGFTLEDQRRLVILFRELADRGVKAIASNSDTATTQELYQEFDVHSVPVRRPINSKGSARGFVQEILAFNFPDEKREEKFAEIAKGIAERKERLSRRPLELEGQVAFNLAMEFDDAEEHT